MTRALGWLVGCAALVVVGAAFGRIGTAAAVMLALGLLLHLHLVMPRAAHRRFVDGRVGAARWRFAVLGALALTRRGARRARLSAVACDLAGGRYQVAAEALAAMPGEQFEIDERAVWLGNRAYAALRAGAAPVAQALAWADAAIALRPDVAALAHTRAMALRAAGQAHAAIAVLEQLWTHADVTPLLEAERCVELAELWAARGEAEYAADYQDRAATALAGLAVTPPWAQGRTGVVATSAA